MARSHGRVLATIWSDEEFRALPAAAQQLYMLLLSQPNLSHAGTISITVRRWAGMAADTTTESVLAALRVLSERRFVVVEWDTEELLIRTLIRNDNVFKQPKVLRAAKADAESVSSPKIRRALRKEIMACPLDQVTENARTEVSSLLTALAEALDTPPDDPNGGLSDSHTDTHGQALAKGSGNLPRSAGAPSPALAPTPAPSPTTRLPASPRNAGDDPEKWLTDRHYERLNGMCSWPGTRGIIRKALTAGRDPTAVDEALQRLVDEGRSLTIESLRIELDGMPAPRSRQSSDGYSENTRGHLALVEKYRAEEERQRGEIA